MLIYLEVSKLGVTTNYYIYSFIEYNNVCSSIVLLTS